MRDLELGIMHEQAITIADATKAFLADSAARKLSRESLKKYRGLFTQLESLAANGGLRYVRQLDLAAMRDFRSSWKDARAARPPQRPPLQEHEEIS